jgi:hypothetical protein
MRARFSAPVQTGLGSSPAFCTAVPGDVAGCFAYGNERLISVEVRAQARFKRGVTVVVRSRNPGDERCVPPYGRAWSYAVLWSLQGSSLLLCASQWAVGGGRGRMLFPGNEELNTDELPSSNWISNGYSHGTKGHYIPEGPISVPPASSESTRTSFSGSHRFSYSLLWNLNLFCRLTACCGYAVPAVLEHFGLETLKPATESHRKETFKRLST